MSEKAERPLRWAFLGRVEYREAVRRQENLRAEIRRGGDDALLLLEHPHVFTLGRSASRRDLLVTPETLARRGASVEECDRGGQVTYHGPGQLVGYPVIDLNPDRRDVRRYVRDLQRVLVATLDALGVAAEGRMEQPEIGVWVGELKIASIGVHLSRWITTHGFALNISTDLDMFRQIVPCGLSSVEMTSVERLTGARLEPGEVAEACAAAFARVFERRLVPLGDGASEGARAAPSGQPPEVQSWPGKS